MAKPTIASLQARIAELEAAVATRDERIVAAKEAYRALRATIAVPAAKPPSTRSWIWQKRDGSRWESTRVGKVTTSRRIDEAQPA